MVGSNDSPYKLDGTVIDILMLMMADESSVSAQYDSLVSWVLAGVGLVVTALSAAVIRLWVNAETTSKMFMQRHEDCEKDRLVLHERIGELNASIQRLTK